VSVFVVPLLPDPRDQTPRTAYILVVGGPELGAHELLLGPQPGGDEQHHRHEVRGTCDPIVDIAVVRWMKATGKQAMLDGMSFDEVKEVRRGTAAPSPAE
jgi:hypothetical protein